MMNEQELIEKLRLLETKYEATGQDLGSYLSGLYETDYLNYWDYIHLDTLLSLQIKRTTLPDEEIFIMYHQITELYFKLILLELKQLADCETMDTVFFESRIGRINRYFDVLIQSFNVMMDGMEPKQFLKFRMALLPASGFQSVQYRLIELASTSAQQLLDVEFKPLGHKLTLEEKLEKIYWRKGSTELSTGKKTLTLQRFEQKYNGQILSFAKEYETKNVGLRIKEINWSLEENQGLKKVLRTLDEQANILWPLAHFHSAMRYLNKPPAVIQATGGTNWQRYLPPKFQKTVFFPELWTEEELENWGKTAFQKATVKPF
jgi:tryptophan 2,3-dioxygenase